MKQTVRKALEQCLNVQLVICYELYLVAVQLLAWTNKPTMCCIMYVNIYTHSKPALESWLQKQNFISMLTSVDQ